MQFLYLSFNPTPKGAFAYLGGPELYLPEKIGVDAITNV